MENQDQVGNNGRPEGPAPYHRTIADELTLHRELIIEQWRIRVLADPRVPAAKRLPKPILMNHLPSFLDEIIRCLSASAETAGRGDVPECGRLRAAEEHGEARAWQGYAVPEALGELSILRSTILDVCFDEQPEPRGQHIINTVIDRAMAIVAEAIVEKGRDEDTRLRGSEARLLEDLKRKTAELSRADRVKDLFLATLSHELRTPLGVIGGFVELLKDGLLEGDQGAIDEALDAIERNVKIQSQLVSDLLDISRIITGKMSIDVSPICLRSVVDDAVAAVVPAAIQRKIKIAVEQEGLLETILGDHGRLQQVVWNLISNAIKFSPEGETIKVTLKAHGDGVEVSVKDEGRGISADLLPYIFDHFRQAEDSTNRKHGGLGLGLALCRQLVELHGGAIAAESGGAGKGALFRVSLPAQRSPV